VLSFACNKGNKANPFLKGSITTFFKSSHFEIVLAIFGALFKLVDRKHLTASSLLDPNIKVLGVCF